MTKSGNPAKLLNICDRKERSKDVDLIILDKSLDVASTIW